MISVYEITEDYENKIIGLENIWKYIMDKYLIELEKWYKLLK